MSASGAGGIYMLDHAFDGPVSIDMPNSTIVVVGAIRSTADITFNAYNFIHLGSIETPGTVSITSKNITCLKGKIKATTQRYPFSLHECYVGTNVLDPAVVRKLKQLGVETNGVLWRFSQSFTLYSPTGEKASL